MKCGENCSSGFREEDIKILHNFIHVYSPGARADKLLGTKFLPEKVKGQPMVII